MMTIIITATMAMEITRNPTAIAGTEGRDCNSSTHQGGRQWQITRILIIITITIIKVMDRRTAHIRTPMVIIPPITAPSCDLT
mgnify:CR=1 FL=1